MPEDTTADASENPAQRGVSGAEQRRTEPARSYQAVAWCYDAIARVYSRSAISAAKSSQVREFEAGQRILFAGIGSGEEAVLAAERGVHVTGIDLSAAMLDRAARAFAECGLEAELIRGDLFRHVPALAYDGVAANFVLNVFGPRQMQRALGHLASLVRPGGKLLIADFAKPPDEPLARWLCRAYYRPINLSAWCLGLCSLHPIYDYSEALGALAFEVVSRRRFPVFRGGPDFYESLVAIRRN